jgi:hypothetical protein
VRQRARDVGAIQEPHDLMGNFILHERIFDALSRRDSAKLRMAIINHYDFVRGEVGRAGREAARGNDRSSVKRGVTVGRRVQGEER